jgi:formylglycine-generating enzyme required for sulfatase activity
MLSDTAPTAVTADTTGIGSASTGTIGSGTGNFANYLGAANWNGLDRNGNVTTVGTNGVSSAYGAFDMNGNITEWNDLTGLVAGSDRGVRGGYWGSFNEVSLQSTFNQEIATSVESDVYGFRLASPAVPEPSTYAMALAGLACGGYSVFRRRKRA